MKKNFYNILMVLIFIILFLFIVFIKKEQTVSEDFFEIGKIIILSLLMIGLKKIIDSFKKGNDLSDKLIITGEIAYDLSYFLIGVILLNYSFYLYHNYLIWKALIFFIFGLIFIFTFFYIFNKDQSILSSIIPVYKQYSLKILIAKIIIAIMLSCLAVYFIKTNKKILVTITYIFLFIQLLLIFILKSTAEDESGKNDYKQTYDIKLRIFQFLIFALSLYLYYLTFYHIQKYNFQFAIFYFILGSLIWTLSFNGYFKISSANQITTTKFDVFYTAFIFILSFLIFSYKLMEVPPGILGDEILSLRMGKKLSEGAIYPIILEEDLYNGMCLSYYLLIAIAGKIFGFNFVVAKWLTIIVSAIEVVFVYLLIKDIFNRRVAVMASILLPLFFMQIFYSRIVLQWGWVPAFATAAYYFFFKGLKDSRPLFFIISGIILSINLGFYSAAKASPIPPFLFILLLLKDKRKYILNNWQGIVLMLLALFLTFLPIIDYMIHFPDKYFKRMEYVSLLNRFPSNFSDWQTLVHHIIMNIQMFFTEAANGHCHNIPSQNFLDGFSSFLLIVGVGYLLITIKQEASLFIILWLFFGLLPGFLSRLGPEDPYPARTVLSIPAIIITLSLGIESIIINIENLNKKIFKFVIPFIIVYIVLWFGFYNLYNYFVVFPNDPHILSYYRNTEKLMFDYIKKNVDKKIYISPFINFNYDDLLGNILGIKTDFLIKSYDISLFEIYKLYNNENKSISINSEGIYYRMFPIFKEYFPNIKIKVFWEYNFWQFDKNSNIKYCYGWKYPDKTIDLNYEYEIFYLYEPIVKFVKLVRAEIPFNDIENLFNLNVDFYKNEVKIKNQKMKFPVYFNNIDYDKIIINGLLDVFDYGYYEFKSNIPDLLIFIDDKNINKATELYKGLHKIKIILNKGNYNTIELKWKNKDMSDFQIIENKYFIDSNKIFGLLAKYKDNNKNIVVYKSLQTVLDYRLYYSYNRPEYRFVGPNDCVIEWSGYIDIKEDDIYSFKLYNLNDAKIIIDNRLIFEKKGDKEYILPVKFNKGKKKIKIIRYNTYDNYEWYLAHVIRFMYKKSEWAEYAPVPYYMLTLN